MKKTIFLSASLMLCFLGNFNSGWIFFAAVFLLFTLPDLPHALIWQLPMGCLIADISLLFCRGYEEVLFRGLFISAAVITSAVTPRKLFILFPVSIMLLIPPLSDASGAFAMSGAIWYGVISAFKTPARKFSRKYG